MSDRTQTVADVAALLGVRTHAVLALIHSGQLRAVDVSLKGRKPRWRILPDDLEGFFARQHHNRRGHANGGGNQIGTSSNTFDHAQDSATTAVG